MKRALLPLFLLAACIGGDDAVDSSGDSTPVTEFETCEALEPALYAELDAIRACDAPSDCGQPLTGTSCGCTRDMVARADVDTARFYEMVSRSGELGCGVGFDSTCDCPEADGYDCIAGVCEWNYVQ